MLINQLGELFESSGTSFTFVMFFKVVVFRDIYLGLTYLRPKVLELLRETYIRLNHTIEVVLTNAETSEEVNGTWTGEIGALVRGEADATLFPAIYDSQLAEIVGFQYVTCPENIGIVSREVTSTSLGDVMVIFQDTEVTVWVLMSLVMLTIMMFNKVSAILISMAENKPNTMQDNNLLTLFGLMLYLGSSRNPNYVSTRVLLQFYLFFQMIFVCLLYANMKSSVAVIRPKFYKTIEDLVEDEHATILYLNTRSIAALFQHSPNKEYRQFWKRVNTPPGKIIEDVGNLAMDINAKIELASELEKKNLALVGAISVMTAFTDTAMSPFFTKDVVLVEHKLIDSFHVIWLNKNIEEKKVLEVVRISRSIVESGLIFPWFELINGEIPFYARKSGEPREVEMESLMLPSLSNAVILWAVGLVASGLCFVAEIAFNKFRLRFRIFTSCP